MDRTVPLRESLKVTSTVCLMRCLRWRAWRSASQRRTLILMSMLELSDINIKLLQFTPQGGAANIQQP